MCQVIPFILLKYKTISYSNVKSPLFCPGEDKTPFIRFILPTFPPFLKFIVSLKKSDSMKKEFCMSYFNAPVAPIKNADGRLLLRATTTPASTLTVEQVYHMITANNCCNKQILNRHFSVKLNRHMIFETLRL